METRDYNMAQGISADGSLEPADRSCEIVEDDTYAGRNNPVLEL